MIKKKICSDNIYFFSQTKMIVLGIIFLVSFLIYFFYIKDIMIVNSDHAYYVIAGKDIMSGNIFLDGWYGSTNTFYFLDVMYGLLGELFGYNINLIYVFSSLLWALTVSMVVYLTISLNDKMDNNKILLILTLIYTSCYFSQSIKIIAGAHLDILLLCFPFIYITSYLHIKNNLFKIDLKLIISSFLFFLAIFSDRLTLYFIISSIIFIYILNILKNKFYNKSISVLLKNFIFTIIIVFLEKIFEIVLRKSGSGIELYYSDDVIKIIPFEQLIDKIQFVFAEILYLFGIDIFNKPIFEVMIYIPRIFLLIFLVVCLFYSLPHITKKIINQIFLCMIILNISVLLLTDYVKIQEGIEYTSRIMYFLFFSLIILLSQVKFRFFYRDGINNNYSKINWNIYLKVFLVIILLITLVNVERKRADKFNTDEKFSQVINVLNDNKLTHGYGTFWLANITTLYSKLKIYVNPVANPTDLSKMKWLSFDTSRWKYANFILVDESKWDNISRETVIESVGEPDKEIKIQDITIMIYSKNIMPYINNSGSNESLDAWWNFEEGKSIHTIKVNDKHFFSVFAADNKGLFISDGEGQLIYGPYKPLSEGIYNITYIYSYEGNNVENGSVIGFVDAFSNSDKIEYKKSTIISGSDRITLKNVRVYKNCTDVELRAYANVSDLSIKEIIIEKAN
ncbi:hypothetical protein [Gallibacterium salpingitidis]|uniref:Uncharacterized protein n=1 Tax=Gallibacterium salpingitidis TaxID=505341 RepID=A0A1A7P0M6_9PAST|nr:hypothetical protein [Gallibacterium salpingitidis]OBW95301.1 hypothetical protein QS62_04070 [Gallibacterium salpingitidis]